MDVERELDGVVVCGRFERVGSLQRVELIKPHGQLSASFPIDSGDSVDGIDSRAAALLDQLYHVARYAHDNQPLLRDILKQVIRRIEASSPENSDEVSKVNGSTEVESSAVVVRREISRFFRRAFPMQVPEECWEQVLRMIA